MSNAAALYAVAVSAPSEAAAVPDEAKELKHHLKDGKGFENPWNSFQHPKVFKLLKFMVWQVSLHFSTTKY
jgi:N-acyl-phosphatidylethanolamine-hydrolysing phospholipase D